MDSSIETGDRVIVFRLGRVGTVVLPAPHPSSQRKRVCDCPPSPSPFASSAAVGLVYWPINNNAIFSLFQQQQQQQHRMDHALPDGTAPSSAAATNHHHHPRQWLHHPHHSHGGLGALSLPAGHHHLLAQPGPGHPAYRDQQGRKLGRDSALIHWNLCPPLLLGKDDRGFRSAFCTEEPKYASRGYGYFTP